MLDPVPSITYNFIGNQLLEELKKKEMNLEKIKKFITDKILEIERKINGATDSYEIDFLKLNRNEWKAFL